MRSMRRFFFSFFCILFSFHVYADVADLVVFSYDRPLQLYAFLESMDTYMDEIGHVHIIYRCSSEDYAESYRQVQQDFQSVQFHQQGDDPDSDFKMLTLKATFDSPNDYVLFAVDDIIVKDYIDVSRCIDMLEKHQAYGFYLRLGRNLTECYSANRLQKLPLLNEVESGVFAWNFRGAEYDWGYPNTVDMTLYRKKDIKLIFNHLNYKAPNLLESHWAGLALMVLDKIGLCFDQSMIVNLPLNRVQNIFQNRIMNFLTASQLLQIFKEGKKIDIGLLHKIDNRSAHMDYAPIFIERK
jgi:hypothetical protein